MVLRLSKVADDALQVQKTHQKDTLMQAVSTSGKVNDLTTVTFSC